MQKIIYKIKPNGEVEIEPIEGFEGTQCEEATAQVEAALGIVTDRMRKDGEGQYRAPTVWQSRG